jgi:hypothetical protein
MKKELNLLMLALLLIAMAAPAPAIAQPDCTEYILLQDNASYELLTYDKKDKQTGRVAYNVKSVDRSNGKTEATIQSQIFDNKDKLTTEGEFKVGCADGAIWMDMRSMMSPQSLEAYKDMDVSMQSDKMLYPNSLQVGQQLEDGTMTVEVKDRSSGQNISTMIMSIVGRKVEGQENIKVPAGTFDSYKISQNTEMENRAMGIKMPGMRIQTVEYYVPKLGTVRSETYRNGKLMSYSVLSKVNQ